MKTREEWENNNWNIVIQNWNRILIATDQRIKGPKHQSNYKSTQNALIVLKYVENTS